MTISPATDTLTSAGFTPGTLMRRDSRTASPLWSWYPLHATPRPTRTLARLLNLAGVSEIETITHEPEPSYPMFSRPYAVLGWAYGRPAQRPFLPEPRYRTRARVAASRTNQLVAEAPWDHPTVGTPLPWEPTHSTSRLRSSSPGHRRSGTRHLWRLPEAHQRRRCDPTPGRPGAARSDHG